jgi:hypothetical protein
VRYPNQAFTGGVYQFGEAGAAVLAGGLAGLVQTPLLAWGLAAGSFLAPNLLLLAGVAAAGYFPAWLLLDGRGVPR